MKYALWAARRDGTGNKVVLYVTTDRAAAEADGDRKSTPHTRYWVEPAPTGNLDESA